MVKDVTTKDGINYVKLEYGVLSDMLSRRKNNQIITEEEGNLIANYQWNLEKEISSLDCLIENQYYQEALEFCSLSKEIVRSYLD